MGRYSELNTEANSELNKEPEQRLWGPRNRDAAWWHVATPLMFGRLSRMTPNAWGTIQCWCRPSCYWEATWGGRSSQGQVSLVSLMAQGGRRACGTIQSTNNHAPKGGLSPVTGYMIDPGRYRGQGLGGRSAPILVLPGQRDARYERPYALCEHHRALPEHGCVLEPPVTLIARVAGRAGLASSRGLTDGCTGAELLLCAPGGAVNMRASRSGAPV